MMRQIRDREARDAGAIAVIVAILSLVLFGIGALAVELTDMYSRDRAVQTTADLAALAGSQDLPDSCAAFNTARAFLNDPGNGVRTDSGTTDFGASVAALRDGGLGNGEIEILNAGKSRVTGCSDAGRYVRVTTPPRNLDFSFGAAVGGASSGSVQATATVQLRGLDVSVLPLSLPANCPSGPNYLYVDNGGVSGGPSGGASPAYSPPGSNNNAPVIVDVNPGTISQSSPPSSVDVTVTDLKFAPSASNPVVFDWHLLRANGSTARSPDPSPLSFPGRLVAGSVTAVGSNFRAVFSVPIGTTIVTTQGSWKVRAMQTGSGVTDKWTDDPGVGTLIVGLPSISSCPNPATGDFGLLDSPRSDGGSTAQKRFRNFALGLDHPLWPVASTTPDLPCVSDGNPYTDGILDDNTPPIGTESCVDVKPGLTADLPTDGLIDGHGGESGRFVGSPQVSTSGGCRVAGDPNLRWTSRSGEDLVNTVLSCYLEPGRSLADVSAGTNDSLKQSIAQDPRFFYVPVVDTTTRPPNGFWPIKTFRGAFVTNERVGGDADCLGLTDCNGLLFNNSGTKLKAIQAFTFPLGALPELVSQPGNGGEYYAGGPKDLLLTQ
jgi:hypothetical protein